MSGHSKWSTIKRQKESTDSKRGLLFSKLGRAISIAARSGASPESNFKLRLAIDRARTANMPKDNIERAISRAAGGDLQEAVYEGYGPSGVAVVVEALTDSKNRTAQEIKNLFERGGGSLASPGSVAYQFEQVGQIIIKKTGDPQGQMLTLIDANVEDVDETEDGIEVYAKPTELRETKGKIEALGFEITNSGLILRPKNLITISDVSQAQKVVFFLETLQGHDDVQEVWANLDIPQEVITQLKP
ncbi:YebC/PmpR family DNA-binding transcriptional regulator [Candidatus Microgenomates bacterium]|nr:YebC/PmpR family DNA-binding transcriptional regulator [Candidatus Microgenomates bacterium]